MHAEGALDHAEERAPWRGPTVHVRRTTCVRILLCSRGSVRETRAQDYMCPHTAVLEGQCERDEGAGLYVSSYYYARGAV
jgi:hypothetical protein